MGHNFTPRDVADAYAVRQALRFPPADKTPDAWVAANPTFAALLIAIRDVILDRYDLQPWRPITYDEIRPGMRVRWQYNGVIYDTVADHLHNDGDMWQNIGGYIIPDYIDWFETSDPPGFGYHAWPDDVVEVVTEAFNRPPGDRSRGEAVLDALDDLGLLNHARKGADHDR